MPDLEGVVDVFVFFFNLFLYVWAFCVHECPCTMCVQCLYGQKVLELELQMVAGHRVGSGN